MEITYDEAIDEIERIPKFTQRPSLTHTNQLMERLGNPERGLKVFHVAGTNGKGSVCAYLTHELMACKHSVGTFISPHLVRMNERICIDNQPIDDAVFMDAFLQVKPVADAIGDTNYFEFLFAMAMLVFSKAQVEYVVLEVGLGGRIDTTNVIERPLVSIITSISLDHTEVLGDSIEQIAAEKAGIIKPGVPVVFDGGEEKASIVIESKADETGSACFRVDTSEYQIVGRKAGQLTFLVLEGAMQGREITVPFAADYQIKNCLLSIKAMEVTGLLKQEADRNAAIDGIARTFWPGRMQQIMPGVFLDGAHNEDGIRQFLNTVKQTPCKGKKYLLFTAVKEKDIRHMAKRLATEGDFAAIITTELENDRRVSAGELASILGVYYNRELTACEDVAEAFSLALKQKGPDDLLFIAGSLYLVGAIIEQLDNVR